MQYDISKSNTHCHFSISSYALKGKQFDGSQDFVLIFNISKILYLITYTRKLYSYYFGILHFYRRVNNNDIFMFAKVV